MTGKKRGYSRRRRQRRKPDPLPAMASEQLTSGHCLTGRYLLEVLVVPAPDPNWGEPLQELLLLEGAEGEERSRYAINNE